MTYNPIFARWQDLLRRFDHAPTLIARRRLRDAMAPLAARYPRHLTLPPIKETDR